ncbi:VWD domain-containing protein [Nocardioides speluncae]|uniref:VWD domain-containing protein n=1 Tax=Nocardioides speluncae TaxID=2670337 RepID=UPI00137A2AA8|nr:VWD domain-containing protein [Nocardioides speluncae]
MIAILGFAVISATTQPASPSAAAPTTASPAAAAADTAEGCPPNSEDPSTVSAVRCIAEALRSSRGYLKDCWAKALTPNAEYRLGECKGLKTIQAEAVAQSRLIARLGGPASPDVQWEVRTRFNKRVDVVYYDRHDPSKQLGMVEAKLHDAVGAARQVTDYVTNWAPGSAGRPRGRYILPLDKGTDEFRIVARDCPNAQGTREVRQYVTSSSAPGVLLVTNPSIEVIKCSDGTKQDDRQLCQFPVAAICYVPPPGADRNANGEDDFWEWFKKQYPEFDFPWVVDPSGSPSSQDDYELVASVAAMLVAVAELCGAVECFKTISTILRTAESAITTIAQLSSLMFNLLASQAYWNVFGDPHIATLDGLAYDLQSVGEFHLLEVPDDGIDVQARFGPRGDNISAMKSIAAEINDVLVEIKGETLRIDGEVQPLVTGEIFDLGDGASVVRNGRKFAVTWPGHGERLTMLVDGWSGAMGVGFRVPEGATTRGLLGNNNGDPQDDLALRDGTQLNAATSAAELHGRFADSWRITDEESVFAYVNGESTATYTDLAFPQNIITLADFSEEEIAAATQVCQDADVAPGPQFEDCVFDVVATGDEAYADQAAVVDDVLVDPAAKPFDDAGNLAEDFEGTVGSNFAAPRYLRDANTSRIAGPLFDSPGYQVTAREIRRHQSLRLVTDLYAFGNIGDDSIAQALELRSGDTVLGRVNFDAAAGPTLSGGLTGTVERTAVNTTTNGTPFSKFALDVNIPHSTSSLDLRFVPKNFRGVLNTSLGVDNVRLSLVVPEPDRFDVALPLTVPSTQAPGGSGAGAIEEPGGQDDYVFNLTTRSSLVVDMTQCTAGLTLAVVNVASGARTKSICRDFTTPELDPGPYRLEATATAIGTYKLSLAQVPAPQIFDYTVGSVVSDGVPSAGAGNLETIASVDQYRFTVPSSRSMQYEELAGHAEFALTRVASGAVVATGNRNEAFDLAAGEYQLKVTGDFAGPYSFRISGVPDPQVFAYELGTVVADGSPWPGAGNLETYASSDRYDFTVPAGGLQLQYEQLTSDPGWTVTNRSDGQVVVRSASNRRITLAAGQYRLEITRDLPGPYSFNLYPVPAPQVFDYPLGTVVSDGQPWQGAGNLETAGSSDHYRFNVTAAMRPLRLDELERPLTWEIRNASSGEVVLHARDGGDRIVLPPGAYVLEYPSGGPKTYSFVLQETPEAQVFQYTLGTTVSDGVPAAGAGNLETHASSDVYTFTVPDGGTSLQYEAISGYMMYRIVDGTGTTVGSGNYRHQHDLPAGNYKLIFPEQEPGKYSFTLYQTPPDQQFDYTLGSTVTDGVPGPGAGRLETGASKDVYRFAIPAGGMKVQVEIPHDPPASHMRTYTITNVANGATVGTGFTLGQHTLPAGNYTITVANFTTPSTTTYTMKIYEVPPPQEFDVELGQAISDGVPGPGAGKLETGASTDVYRFSVPEGGARVQLGDGSSFMSYRLYNDTTGALIASTTPYSKFDLPAGRYRAEIFAQGYPWSYTYSIYEAPALEVFDYEIGSTVSDAVPAPGAGYIEEFASTDRYRFTIPAGGLAVQYEVLAGQPIHRLTNLTTGRDEYFNQDGSARTLPAGDYQLDFYAYPHWHPPGAYSFRLKVPPPPPDVFNYQLGTEVSNGTPWTGSGNLETPGSVDQYEFTVTDPSTPLRLNILAGGALWALRDAGSVDPFMTWDETLREGVGHAGHMTLPAGDYVLDFFVDPANSNSRTYSFKLAEVPQEFELEQLPASVADGSPEPGAGNLENAAASDIYNFSLGGDRNEYLWFSLTGNKRWQLVQEWNQEVVDSGQGSARIYAAEDSSCLSQQLPNCSDFRIVFPTQTPGPYGFTLAWECCGRELE